LVILDRLHYLIGLIEADRAGKQDKDAVDLAEIQHAVSGFDPSSVENGVQSTLSSTQASHVAPSLARYARPTIHLDGFDNAESLTVPQIFYGSSEDILDWSVFQSKHDRDQIEKLIFDPTIYSDRDAAIQTPSHALAVSPCTIDVEARLLLSTGRGIREEDVPALVERFLSNVHTKNPIFDSGDLRRIAKAIAGSGFAWDASTCLIVSHAPTCFGSCANSIQLLACACAVIAEPFLRTPITQCVDADSLTDSPNYATAEAYYDAARKRIGLLTNTHMATECHFLAGVYEMYSLRPLRASISFNRACVAFQALTWMKSERWIDENRLEKSQTSRLYWSCLKSEQ
jgi:hypothetical protein